MASSGSLTIVKTFDYRGNPEEYSNTYHFNGGVPVDAAHWKTFADAVIAAEKLMLDSTVTIIRAIGHVTGTVPAAFFYDYAAHSATVAGTLAAGTGQYVPGDCAAWIRWPTTAVTSRGKPIYLRSYYHGIKDAGNSHPNCDLLMATQKTAMETYGAAWVTGFSDGTHTLVRSGPGGATGGTAVASTYLTTRTLERRGKRSRP
jgi:hypothetical protein